MQLDISIPSSSNKLAPDGGAQQARLKPNLQSHVLPAPAEVNHAGRNVSDIAELGVRSAVLARQAGVTVARRSFWASLLSLTTATLAVAGASLMCIASAGAAAPLVVLASISLGMAVADTITAAAHWLRLRKGLTGLPMQGDAVGNLVYWLATRHGDDTPESLTSARRWASTVSIVSRLCLSLATALTGALDPFTLQASIAKTVVIISSVCKPIIDTLAAVTRQLAAASHARKKMEAERLEKQMQEAQEARMQQLQAVNESLKTILTKPSEQTKEQRANARNNAASIKRSHSCSKLS